MDRNPYTNSVTTDLTGVKEYESEDWIDSGDPSEVYPPECDLEFITRHRRKKRRDKEVHAAFGNIPTLSRGVQDRLLGIHLAGGWGRFSHGMARHFKAPSRYGHRLVDLAILTTIYDKTIACVTPVMFVALTIDSFVAETEMDESNIRKALKSLVLKGALLRVEASSRVNFWAINPHFFTIKERSSVQGKSPRGKLPAGNAPRSNQGDSPRVMTGQITQGKSQSTIGNQAEFLDVKNPLQESEEESLLSVGRFPADMLARWSCFQKRGGLDSRILREKEIFERVFRQHKDSFFHFCGRVVEFLEKVGTVKAGSKSEIHCPMTWIEGHWEQNLTQYRVWKTEQEDLKQAHALKADREAKAKAEQAAKDLQDEKDIREEAAWKAEQDAATIRFQSQYSTEKAMHAFSAEAIELLGCSFTRDAWEKKGWNHPLARSCVLHHFMKVERGERTTQVRLSAREEIA